MSHSQNPAVPPFWMSDFCYHQPSAISGPSDAASAWSKEHALRCHRQKWKTFVGQLCSETSILIRAVVQDPTGSTKNPCSSSTNTNCWMLLRCALLRIHHLLWVEDALCPKTDLAPSSWEPRIQGGGVGRQRATHLAHEACVKGITRNWINIPP